MPVLDTEILFGLNPRDKHHGSTLKILKELSERNQKIFAPDSSVYEFQAVLSGLNKKLPEIMLAMISLKQAFEENGIEEAKTLSIGTILAQCELEEEYSLTYFDSLIAASALTLDKIIVSDDRVFDKVPSLSRISIRKGHRI
ncbi:MAG: PIN domain-containing protein [Nitrososphaerales archaeon]